MGSSLLRTVLIAALAPFAVRFAIATLAKYKRKRALEKSIIQEDLNIAYVGPQVSPGRGGLPFLCLIHAPPLLWNPPLNSASPMPLSRSLAWTRSTRICS